MDPLAGVENTALTEGVKLVFQQAAEVLRAWRARRDRQAPAPQALEPAPAAGAEDSHPRPGPADAEMDCILLELEDLVKPFTDGQVDPASPAALGAAARLGELLELMARSPVISARQQPRTVVVSDVDVAVQGVDGQVAGVRANSAELQGPAAVIRVRVHTGDVDGGGAVTGVDLT
jgi:hypothetical protein